jgi:dTDP-4-amino-4,6-dideoxygalactose transaminase
VENRDELQKHLSKANIGTSIHYPIPLHLQKAYSHLGYERGEFPVSEKSAAKIVSLPMYPGLNAEQQREVAEQVMALVSPAPARGLAAAASSAFD